MKSLSCLQNTMLNFGFTNLHAPPLADISVASAPCTQTSENRHRQPFKSLQKLLFRRWGVMVIKSHLTSTCSQQITLHILTDTEIFIPGESLERKVSGTKI